MLSTHRGFTIVELLITIVVISILASVTVVAFNGVQTKAKNAARLSDVQSWHKIMQLYKATNGSYPNTLVNGTLYCLGDGFPIGAGGVARCRDYQSSDATSSYVQSDNISFMSQLRTVSSLPKSDRTPVNGTVGPYMAFYGTGTIIYRIYGALNGSSAADCPAPTAFLYAYGGLAICGLDSTT